MKQKILELKLPSNQFIVVGSGVMAALGIRESDDIDLIVSQAIFDNLDSLGWERDTWVDQTVLKSGPFDIGRTWDGKTVDELMKTAIVIEGIPYLNLSDLRKWKQARGRDKDIRDIELIDAYLEARK